MNARTAAGPRCTPLEPWVLARAGAFDIAGLRRYQLRALRETVARVKALSPSTRPVWTGWSRATSGRSTT